jgi:Domain of unknown function (DUF4388)
VSVEGQLTEVGVADVLRLLCLSFRAKELMVMRAGSTGRVVVGAGEIVYARVGALSGEGAVVELLRWREGIFKVGETPGLYPERNVRVPLTELIVRAARPPAVPRPEPSQAGVSLLPCGEVHDTALDAALVDLFSRLEREVARLEGLRSGVRSAQAVPVFEALLARIAATGAGHLTEGFGEAGLRNLVERQAALTPALRLARVDQGRISLALAEELLASPAVAEAQRSDLFAELASALLGLVNALFSRLIRSFSAEDLRQQWEETREAFLTDLIAALETVRR